MAVFFFFVKKKIVLFFSCDSVLMSGGVLTFMTIGDMANFSFGENTCFSTGRIPRLLTELVHDHGLFCQSFFFSKSLDVMCCCFFILCFGGSVSFFKSSLLFFFNNCFLTHFEK